ncbi:MAG: hemerythrin domain-containing protein [Azonexus sp.]|jgi:hemerythrin-like metal-binding protein|nr:hemerythrin domain-containing protein [Azonexus sp.]
MYQIDIAQSSHKIYLLHLDWKLDGIENIDVNSNAHECNFGKWLDTADTSYQSLKHFSEIKQVHQHFHEQTCELLRLLKDKGSEEVRNYFDTTLIATSTQLFNLMDNLKVDRRIQLILENQVESNQILNDLPVELLTGVPIIDSQHKELHALTQRLLDNKEERVYAEHASELLSSLNHLFLTHFDTEESYMKSKGIEEHHIEQHIAQHQHFLEELVNLQFESMSHTPLTASEVYGKLMEWELNHMRTSDIYLKTNHNHG